MSNVPKDLPFDHRLLPPSQTGGEEGWYTWNLLDRTRYNTYALGEMWVRAEGDQCRAGDGTADPDRLPPTDRVVVEQRGEHHDDSGIGGADDRDRAQVALLRADRGVEAALKAAELDPEHPSALVYASLLMREKAARQEGDAADASLDEAQRLVAKFKDTRALQKSKSKEGTATP